MAKRKKTITAGCIVKTILYTAPEPRDGERARAEKSRMTTAAQKAMNDKTARCRLEMLLAANFVGRDIFLTLTYRDADLPSKRAGAVKKVRKFIKQLREYRKARGQVLKYVYTTEGKHGAGRLHHHLVINATERDIEVIRSLWPYGDMIDLVYVRDRDYDTLARYMTKESVEGRPVGAQMWTRSRNLEQPVVESCFVPDDTALAVPPGCFVLEREEKATEYGCYSYIKYRVPSWRQQQSRPEAASERPERVSQYLTCKYI